MAENYISRKDRIIASAIEIISDSGISALTTKNLAAKENMSEALIYKYFGSIDEVLVEVVEFYFKYDNMVRKSSLSKEGGYIDKLRYYLETYAEYYDNYYAIATFMLQYEELLHNIDTRERISSCITERIKFIQDLFQKAIDNNEIKGNISASELANNVTGITMSHILVRRIEYHSKSFKQEYMANLEKWFELLKV